jgi:hypothetical protein
LNKFFIKIKSSFVKPLNKNIHIKYKIAPEIISTKPIYRFICMFNKLLKKYKEQNIIDAEMIGSKKFTNFKSDLRTLEL